MQLCYIMLLSHYGFISGRMPACIPPAFSILKLIF